MREEEARREKEFLSFGGASTARTAGAESTKHSLAAREGKAALLTMATTASIPPDQATALAGLSTRLTDAIASVELQRSTLEEVILHLSEQAVRLNLSLIHI